MVIAQGVPVAPWAFAGPRGPRALPMAARRRAIHPVHATSVRVHPAPAPLQKALAFETPDRGCRRNVANRRPGNFNDGEVAHWLHEGFDRLNSCRPPEW